MDAERIARNDATFREANEQIERAAEPLGIEPIPFLCECADDDCLGRVDMNLADYDDIHRDRSQYAVLHDHQIVDGEKVVEERALYDIVSKAALAG